MKTIAVTSGEAAGIGPDTALALAHTAFDARLVVLGDCNLLQERAAAIGTEVALDRIASPEFECKPVRTHAGDGRLAVLHIPTAAPVSAGHADTRNTAYVLEMLERAVQGCLSGHFSALVTGPVNKALINRGGVAFSGHTEYLAAACNAAGVMLLETRGLRVALATTHLPLSGVSGALTRESLEQTLRILHTDLRKLFGIDDPRIAVCGLNPHAGEQGCLGSEETTVIAPVIADLAGEGLRVFGPVSADTAFTPQNLERSDVIVAMYHDQGLPVIKCANFGEVVNITLGLPFIRTSVDHGTALELAGSGRASASSLVAAVRRAIELVRVSRGGGQ